VAIAPAIQVIPTGSSPAASARSHDNIIHSTPLLTRALKGELPAVRFAHPAERHVASHFDRHGVRWRYEPTTFPLITSLAGEPVQSFTPDFYLPDHDVYLEMTTMRQSLVTRKNRKFRLMRQSYPDVDVRLLYRKDVELIVDWYGERPATTRVSAGQVFATQEQIARKVHEIAAHLQVLAPVALIPAGDGAIWFRDALARELADSGSAVLESRVDSLGLLPARCTVVLVADIVGTGLTAHAALRSCRAGGRETDTVVALLDRRSARLVDVPLAVPALPAPSAWVAGCGLGPEPLAARPDLVTVCRCSPS
jgi:hypothetical protein